MEHWLFWGVGILLVLGAVLLLGGPGKVALPYRVEIVKFEPIGSDEIVTIKNLGKEAVDLSGWRLVAVAGFEFKFPQGCSLPAGASLKIHSGPLAAIHRPFLGEAQLCPPNGDLLWTPEHIWCDQNGDTALLYDARGRLVHKYDYGIGYHESLYFPCDRAGEGEKPALELP
jgi:hypothetical protein